MNIGDLRDLIASHARSTQVLSALGLALEARLHGTSGDGEVVPRTDAVVEALGAAAALQDASPAELTPMLATIRSELLMGGRLMSDGSNAGGWRQSEDRLHQAFGDLSAGFAPLLRTRISGELPGLAEALDAPAAAFLDVGTGVGALALGMLREWPRVRVVGIDPLPGVIVQAQANIAAAGLSDRVSLRVGRGEDITEISAFDLVFVPTAFIAEPAVTLVVERSAAALRPGGWLLLATVDTTLDPLPAALVRFRVATWGGTNFPEGAAEALLARHGLSQVRRIRGRPGMPFSFVAGRQRPERAQAADLAAQLLPA
jgi:SAM-dependent methyltransferase